MLIPVEFAHQKAKNATGVTMMNIFGTVLAVAMAQIFQRTIVFAQQMSVSQIGNPRIDFIPAGEQSRASRNNLLGIINLLIK